ncbi:C39 family peptidase [Micromonospora zhanjiangensis]|uniref:C39 family peptidase n=1 Tax=Micromonospora zhanjiangensis TaxID=1522057 RepID=A0ABV8KEB9_9ACTN
MRFLPRSAEYTKRFLGLAVAALAVTGLLIGTVQLSSAKAKAKAGVWHSVSIDKHPQQDSTWCGPAAGETLLSAFGLRFKQQKTLADQMHTGFLGTAPSDATAALNAQLKKNNKSIRYGHKAGIGPNELYTAAKRGLDHGAPSMIVVKSRNIWYPHASIGTAHYLVIYGYNDNWVVGKKSYGKTWAVYDPADNTLHHLAVKDYGSEGKNAGYWGGDVIVPLI